MSGCPYDARDARRCVRDDSVSGFEDPRAVLRRYGLRPRRALSQCLLVRPSVHAAIARAVGAGPGVRVCEIGAGVGTLTGVLLATGARVVAVEKDPAMVALLEREWVPRAGGALRVLQADATRLDLMALAAEPPGGPLRLAGNLPYHVTGLLLRRLCEHVGALERAVVMVQREVRDRLLAAPGQPTWGALGVFVSA
ncbi:MAG: hypothetical protein NZ898_08965, partial [Myxococcota bacterium]|nr:hypothetical protein [Myxococcota bacterium]